MADTSSVTANMESEKQDDPMKNYEFDGQTYIYTDKATNITYKFDQQNNKWIVKEDNKVSSDSKKNLQMEKKEESDDTEAGAAEVFGFENDTHTYTDPNDGSVYFWDKEKNAWFPKVDEDFMAKYQMSYGFSDTSTPQPKPPEPKQLPPTQKIKEEKEQRRVEAKRKAQEPPTWFEVDEAHNTAIYVSGLPLDITIEELTQLFTKCGLIARDEKGKDKIKLYKDGNGEPKGDALCTYIKAIQFINCARYCLAK
ncbi:HIV Tat-specific factor 1 like protein [Atta colombica]|uniref:HIV Tat-specific factor 1 like protein n=1 Tax=Atta colombica TaxID=520822 RepID=A0A195BIY8_9HYME|nr:HIV Tat-specific factor 1 like protein [Atta colombica]